MRGLDEIGKGKWTEGKDEYIQVKLDDEGFLPRIRRN